MGDFSYNKSESSPLPPLHRTIQSDSLLDYYDLAKLVRGVYRYRSLIVIVTVLFSTLGVYLSYKTSSFYVAEATVLFKDNKYERPELLRGYSLPEITMGTAIDMIQQQSNYEAVKSLLGLDLSVKEIGNMIEVELPKRSSNLLIIRCFGGQEYLTRDIVNTVAQVAVKSSQDVYKKQVMLALGSYRSRVEGLRHQLLSQLSEIEAYKNKHRYFDGETNSIAILNELESARKSHQESILAYNGLVAEYKNLKEEFDGLADRTPITHDTLGRSVNTLIIELQKQLAEAKSKYTPNNPKVLLVEDQLKDLIAKTQESENEQAKELILQKNPIKEQLKIELMKMRGKLRSAFKEKEDTAQAVALINEQITLLPAKQIGYMKLIHAMESTEVQLKEMETVLERMEVLVNIPHGSLGLYQLSTKADESINKKIVYGLPIIAFLFGLFGSVSLILLVEVFDRKYRTAKDLGLSISIPCVAEVPEMRRFKPEFKENQLLPYLRRLVDHLDLPKEENGILTVTSSVAKEGKSTFAHQLAEYYQLLGKRVLLMNLDYRPSFFSKRSQIGATLESCLEGVTEIDEIIETGEVDQIRIGGEHPLIKEQLKSKKMQEIWNELVNMYDLIVIDSPGVLQDEYAVDLAVIADYCLFVVGSSTTNKGLVNESLEILDSVGARPEGIVLNRIRSVYVDDKRQKSK